MTVRAGIKIEVDSSGIKLAKSSLKELADFTAKARQDALVAAKQATISMSEESKKALMLKSKEIKEQLMSQKVALSNQSKIDLMEKAKEMKEHLMTQKQQLGKEMFDYKQAERLRLKFTQSGLREVAKAYKEALVENEARSTWKEKGVMGLDHKQFKMLHPLIAETGTRLDRLTAWARKATIGFKGFRMEMLGVMFFGQALKRIFSDLINPAMEAYGIFELWGATLQVFFLPIVDAIFPILMSFMDALMNSPESVQVAVGAIALLGIGFGQLLATIGMMSLGVGSILDSKIWTGLAKSFSDLVPLAKDLGGAFNQFVDILFNTDDVKAIANFKTKLNSIKEQLNDNKALRVFSFAVGLYVLYLWEQTVDAMMTDFKTTFLNRMKSVVEGAISGALIGYGVGGVAGGALGAQIGIGLSIVLNLLDFAWEKDFDTKMIGFAAGVKGKVSGAVDKLSKFIKTGSFGYSTEVKDGILQNKKENDFIWRPGQGSVSINPNDTLVGFKGSSLFGSQGTTINQTLNINVANVSEFEKIVQQNNRDLKDMINSSRAIPF